MPTTDSPIGEDLESKANQAAKNALANINNIKMKALALMSRTARNDEQRAYLKRLQPQLSEAISHVS